MKYIDSGAAVEKFIQRGGKVKHMPMGGGPGHEPVKKVYNKYAEAKNESYKKLKENGFSPAEARTFIKGETIMKQKYCDYK